MREIEFRAWSKERKIYAEIMHIDFVGKFVTVMLQDKDVINGELYNIWFFDEIVLEQYTGLKDKKGTKIFEGDIISYIDGDDIDGGVIKQDKYGYIYFKDKRDFTYGNEVSIVGNIHEESEKDNESK